ncbi:MAG: hypothetical protein Q9203_003636 [Teloschistes exilis]
MDVHMTWKDLDVIVIGAGFSGILAVYKNGSEASGVRTPTPEQQLTAHSPPTSFYEAELHRDWREQFPTRLEMLKCFEHVDNHWEISTSFEFGASVARAGYSEASQRWTVSLEDGRRADARWLVPAVGSSSVINMPRIPGVNRFRGPIYHTAKWPLNAMDMRGKKVAVIGTGPSGVQVIQSVGKVAEAMTIYQRTPYLTLRKYSSPDRTAETLGMGPDDHREALQLGLQSSNGFNHALRDQDVLAVSAQEQNFYYKKRYLEGGWAFWMGGFRDLYQDLEANRDAYAFWAEQTRARIRGAAKRELLVPEIAALPFGVKRPCLEEDLYEVWISPTWRLSTLARSQSRTITETGICAYGQMIDFDAIILVTGFGDEASGPKSLNIRGRNGVALQDAWSEGVQSHLGISVNQFPNMFFLYGPQCPTLLVNSPAVVTVEVEWLCRIISDCQQAGISQLEATGESHQVWQQKMEEVWVKSLYHKFPRKNKKGSKMSKEERTWIGGLLLYREELESCLANGLEGFQDAGNMISTLVSEPSYVLVDGGLATADARLKRIAVGMHMLGMFSLIAVQANIASNEDALEPELTLWDQRGNVD